MKFKYKSTGEKAAAVVAVLIIATGVVALQGLIIMWLWNFLASYFGFMKITFPIALAISFIVGILFRSGGGSK